MPYPFSEIEPKWQKFWEENQTFKTPDDFTRKKLYILDMFPYPSGSGLHVGHPEGYTATDIFCRFKRMNGFNVLHPMGWDAFGLPAERYAMQTGVHPAITTKQNIDNFRRQIKMLGLSYDWSREFSTTDPKYVKWTQWIFLKLYNSWFDTEAQKARPITELEIPAGMSEREQYDFVTSKRLAYLSEMPVNWCEELGTVLANEEVDEWVEKGYKVERRAMRQWMLRITAYAERLEADLSLLNWPNGILEMQRNWVGKSTGAEVDFKLENGNDKLRIYTTRPDTLFGATYMVISPEHPLVNTITTPAQKTAVQEYIQQTAFKSELERTSLDKEKTGVFTGAYAFNPTNGKKIPVWIADYVLITYGTGAIMAVPGHDDRDHEFAVKYKLPIIEVVSGGDVQKAAHTDEGVGVNSANPEVSLNGLASDAAKAKIIRWLEAKKIGQSSVKYKLRDWLFSRQRYWGEPFPLVYREDGTVVDLPESQLPIVLPETESFKPSGTGESALATVPAFVNTIDPATGKPARRETHTMPQWAGSCWYYLRYIDPHNDDAFISPEKEKYWMPIDLYVGGAEHAVLHLLYARFWHKVLFDLGLVSTSEPFARLVNQGLILGENGQKMSKSMGNVVNPDDVVKEYGADSLRLFEMFMGPLQDVKPWSTRGVDGVHRFLNRAWRMIMDDDTNQVHAAVQDVPMTPEQERVLHQTIKKVTEDIDSLNFNTAISQMMIFVNEFLTATPRPRQAMDTFVLLLAPYAPHLAEELWQKLGHTTTLSYEPWPKYDDAKTREDRAEIVVQISGKVRAKFSVSLDATEAEIQNAAMADPAVVKWIEGKDIVKVIVVKGKLVNIVVK